MMEFMVVLIIIGILTIIGLFQFGAVIEKSRTSEAKMNLGNLRKAEMAYWVDGHGTYTDLMSDLFIQVPKGCDQSSHYFSYKISNAGVATYTLEADRCVEGGKYPPGPAYNITLDQDDTWGGTPGYF